MEPKQGIHPHGQASPPVIYGSSYKVVCHRSTAPNLPERYTVGTVNASICRGYHCYHSLKLLDVGP